jgi:hypothetical protein
MAGNCAFANHALRIEREYTVIMRKIGDATRPATPIPRSESGAAGLQASVTQVGMLGTLAKSRMATTSA